LGLRAAVPGTKRVGDWQSGGPRVTMVEEVAAGGYRKLSGGSAAGLLERITVGAFR